jgi:heavy metal efflux system protein
VRIEQLYDRTDLVNRTIHTITRNLIEGGALVIAVLLLLLGSFRAGVVVSLAIPLSMLTAFIGMVQAKVSGNLMSLGAIRLRSDCGWFSRHHREHPSPPAAEKARRTSQ